MSKLPEPTGWRILIKTRKVEEKTKGGIYIPDSTKEVEEMATIVGQVLSMGDECFKDKARFFSEWCAVGDWIVLPKFTGYKFNYNGEKYLIVNDTDIIAKIDDPQAIRAA